MNDPTHPAPSPSWTLSIDFGTSNTAAAQRSTRRSGVEAVALTHQGNLMPSSVFVDGPDRIDVGDVALNRAQTAPTSFIASPKRLVAQGSVRAAGLDLPIAVPIAAVLRSVIDRATTYRRGQPPAVLILTHPEAWSPREVAVLEEAANRAGYGPGSVSTLSEPRAAAHFYSRSEHLEPGTSIAVFDFGGGTVDVAVLSATAGGTFDVVAARGDNGLGGKNLDASVRRWVDRRLDDENPELSRFLRTDAALHTLRTLDDSIRRAKELLSSTESATIAIGDSRTDRQHILTLERGEFETIIASEIERAVALTHATLAEAHALTGSAVHALYLTGGSSRIPLVHRALHSLGHPIATLDDPKTVVARGALLALPDRLGATPVKGSHAFSGAPSTQPAPVVGSGPDLPISPAPPARGRGRLVAAAAGTVAVAGAVIAAVVLAPWDSTDPVPSTASGQDDTAALESVTNDYLDAVAAHDDAAMTSFWCAANREKRASTTPSPAPTSATGDLELTAAEFIGTSIYGDKASTRIRLQATVDGEPSTEEGDGEILAFDFGREEGQWRICRQTIQ